jgi:hypothetical protein
MNLLVPDLRMAPGANVVVSSLFDSKDAGFLTQDLFLVELPGETYIDVSWFPEHDPKGAYTISVLRGRDQIHDEEAGSAREALSVVERLATEYTRELGNASGSASEPKTFDYRTAESGDPR